MPAIVVAVEYDGDITAAGSADTRMGTCEHAYDLESATLIAHTADGETLKVGFPIPQRAWNSDPEFARCAQCETAVASIVRTIVRAALTAAKPEGQPGPS
jgi:hypothetical protein